MGYLNRPEHASAFNYHRQHLPSDSIDRLAWWMALHSYSPLLHNLYQGVETRSYSRCIVLNAALFLLISSRHLDLKDYERPRFGSKAELFRIRFPTTSLAS